MTKKHVKNGKELLDAEAGIPRCPDWLSDEAKDFFKILAKDINKVKVLWKTDQQALAVLADCFARWRQAIEFLNEKGMTYTLASGYEQQYPQVAIANNLIDKINKMLIQFGLTPYARQKVNKSMDAVANNDDWLSDITDKE